MLRSGNITANSSFLSAREALPPTSELQFIGVPCLPLELRQSYGAEWGRFTIQPASLFQTAKLA